MAKTDVIPFGDGQFLIQFHLTDLPEEVDFGRDYKSYCLICLGGDDRMKLECIIHRPTNGKSAVGIPLSGWLVMLLETDLSAKQLWDATIEILWYGAELNDQDAMLQRILAKHRESLPKMSADDSALS